MSNPQKSFETEVVELLEKVLENQDELLARQERLDEAISNLNLSGRDYSVEYDDESF